MKIEGLVTNTKLLKDGAVGLTFDEFEKMIKDDLKGYSPYDLPNEWNFNKRTFIMSCLFLLNIIVIGCTDKRVNAVMVRCPVISIL